MKVGLTFGTSMLSLRDKEAAMKSRYTVERELADVMVDKRIKRKCNSGSNLNYIWQNEKELLKFFEFLLKEMRSDEGLDCGGYKWRNSCGSNSNCCI